MSQVIRKYVIKQSLALPSDSRIVHIAHQGDVPVMWCLHRDQEDSRAPVEVRYFEVFATGQRVVQGAYLATWVQADSNFEWHLFEVPQAIHDGPSPKPEPCATCEGSAFVMQYATAPPPPGVPDGAWFGARQDKRIPCPACQPGEAESGEVDRG